MPGPGARQPVVAPQRRAPLISLLTSAEFVGEVTVPTEPTDPNSPHDTNVDRWLNGIKYRPERSGIATVEPVGCTTGHNEESPSVSDSAHRGEVDIDPFMVIVEEQCSTFGWSANEYVDRARRLLEASEAYAVEHEFWTGTQAQAGISAGVDYPNNQWLAQQVSSTTLNSGAAIASGKGLGLLQMAIGDATGGSPGMIHVPPPVLNAWLTAMIVTPIPPTGKTPPRYVDAFGNIVVPGYGYSVNTGPDGSTPAAGTYWGYATGMVYIRRNDPVVNPPSYNQALVKSGGDFVDDLKFYVNRYYSLDWDHAVHAACLLTPCDVC